MHYEKYLINLTKQEKLNTNNINNPNEVQNVSQSREANKANNIPSFNPINLAMGNMTNIPPHMGNLIQGNMAAAAMGSFPFNMMRPGMHFMPTNPKIAAKIIGKMNPNNFPL